MTTALDHTALDYTALDRTALDHTALDHTALDIGEHLPECPDRSPGPDACNWCRWAVDGAGVNQIIDTISDVGALSADYDRRCGAVSVPWVVAATELLSAPLPQPEAALIPSTGELLSRLHQVLHDCASPLADRIDLAVAAGGPVERRCLISAGPLAAAALQRPQHAATLDLLPHATRQGLDRAARLLSADNQAAELLTQAETQHWDGVPTLRTQPAWERRASRQHARAAPSTTGGPRAGSFEALVVESAIDTVTDEIDQIAGDLVHALPRREMARPNRSVLSERTRLLTWRIARIDWHLTFVDTGRTDCWSKGGALLVPWTVALAIEECERAGLVSATHQSTEPLATPTLTCHDP